MKKVLRDRRGGGERDGNLDPARPAEGTSFDFRSHGSHSSGGPAGDALVIGQYHAGPRSQPDAGVDPWRAGDWPGRTQIRLGRLWFDRVTMEEAIGRIDELVRARRRSYVVTPNVDHLVRARQDAEYAAIVDRADLVLADGQPLVWLSRLVGAALPERVAGSDLFPRLCGHAATRGWRVFFLGGDPGAAEAARDVLTARHPNLNVVGTHCPPVGFERDPAARQAALAAVRAAEADIVFVGLGSPKQERWIVAHLSEYGPAVSIGVGISFSFTAGRVRRAPRWVQRLGLEWLHRVCQEPRRLAGRYFVRGWGFVPIAVADIVRVWIRGERAGAARARAGAA